MRIICFLALSISLLAGRTYGQSGNIQETSSGIPAEIIYHLFQRSFYDTNGDLQGDLKGVEQKLDYLQDLGITSILLLPLYESVYYHNYFPGDFEKIDAEFGLLRDYISLVEEIHKRGMKVYMDMETQYITEDHLWFHDSYARPESPFTDYLLYNGPDNTEPESIIFNLTELEGYDGEIRKITTLNLLNPEVQQYLFDLYSYWLDPNKDGDFSDGVDGFRIDHMMDDLDWKGKLTGLFKSLWKPLFNHLRSINPKVKIVGEQADWFNFGPEYFQDAELDWLFAFAIKFGIGTFNKLEIQNKIDSTFQFTPRDRNQLIFLENHDTRRWATEVKGNPGLLRVGAALNLLLPGIPTIYYGQEIGMKGEGGFQAFGSTDANDIPRREAFEWYSTVDQPGMALWYKNTGPWWNKRNITDNDGISVEEQMEDAGSLWNFYKKLITLRKSYPALHSAEIHFLENGTENVLSFLRTNGDEKILVHVNLAGDEVRFKIVSKDLTSGKEYLTPLSYEKFEMRQEGDQFLIKPYGIQIAEISH